MGSHGFLIVEPSPVSQLVLFYPTLVPGLGMLTPPPGAHLLTSGSSLCFVAVFRSS